MMSADTKEDNHVKREAGEVIRDFFNVSKIKRFFRVGSGKQDPPGRLSFNARPAGIVCISMVL